MKYVNHYFWARSTHVVRAYTSTEALRALADNCPDWKGGLGDLVDVRRENENGGPGGATLAALPAEEV